MKGEIMKLDDNSVILLKGRLDGIQKTRLTKLLDMLYLPSEIAEEIGFGKRQFQRVYIPAGCPIERDKKNHIWINGKDFREWVLTIYQKQELKQNEAFCLTCKHPFSMKNPERLQSGNLYYYLVICPKCGRKVARIITRGKEL
jgi:uncharacterized protein with PIN domain